MLAAPFWFAFLYTLEGENSIIKRPAGLNTFLLRHNATDLLSFLLPGNYHSPDLWAEYHEYFLHTTYLGFVVLFAASWALGHKLGRKWMVIGAVFAVLSLGPYLFVGGKFVAVGGYLIPLPFAILSQVIGLMAITHPSRMALITIMSLAVLGGMGLDRLEQRFPGIRNVFSAGFLLAAARGLKCCFFFRQPFPMVTASCQGLGGGLTLNKWAPKDPIWPRGPGTGNIPRFRYPGNLWRNSRRVFLL